MLDVYVHLLVRLSRKMMGVHLGYLLYVAKVVTKKCHETMCHLFKKVVKHSKPCLKENMGGLR
jgi:hypothetical protein